MLDPDLTVSQVLAANPQAWRAFVDLKTDCVGCYLMTFCSLREVAAQYQIDLAKVLDALSSAIPEKDFPDDGGVIQ